MTYPKSYVWATVILVAASFAMVIMSMLIIASEAQRKDALIEELRDKLNECKQAQYDPTTRFHIVTKDRLERAIKMAGGLK